MVFAGRGRSTEERFSAQHLSELKIYLDGTSVESHGINFRDTLLISSCLCRYCGQC